MSSKTNVKRRMSTRKLTVTSMMVAITMILAYTPLGIIPLQPVSATTTHIPTIIIAILEGPLVGGIVGASFGLVSMFKAITQPSGVLSPFFINPLVSVIPRILIGVVAGYSYIILKKMDRKGFVAAVIASALGSITNTVGAMGTLYLIYGGALTAQIGSSAGIMIWGVITSFGVMEMLAACVICTAMVAALQRAVYRQVSTS